MTVKTAFVTCNNAEPTCDRKILSVLAVKTDGKCVFHASTEVPCKNLDLCGNMVETTLGKSEATCQDCADNSCFACGEFFDPEKVSAPNYFHETRTGSLMHKSCNDKWKAEQSRNGTVQRHFQNGPRRRHA